MSQQHGTVIGESPIGDNVYVGVRCAGLKAWERGRGREGIECWWVGERDRGELVARQLAARDVRLAGEWLGRRGVERRRSPTSMHGPGYGYETQRSMAAWPSFFLLAGLQCTFLCSSLGRDVRRSFFSAALGLSY